MTDVDAAVAALEAGELVVLPTDTVYGVAAHLRAPHAIELLFEVKGRPSEKAIPILGSSLDDLRAVARFDERADEVAGSFWPGPLTLVLPRSAAFDVHLGGSDSHTVAVRVPAQASTRAVLARTGPLAVTSANRAGEPAASTVEAARAALGSAVAVYVDGGEAAGAGSTIVSLVGEPVCLRDGDLPYDDVLRRLDRVE